MLSFLPGPLKGVMCSGFIFIQTLFYGSLVYIILLVKIVCPVKSWRQHLTQFMMWIVKGWMWGITGMLFLTQKCTWDLRGTEQLTQKDWYFVNSNHQSWADILILLHIFNGRIPFIKFFLKQELIWVPVIGGVWWALDYPFMKRFSKTKLKKKPHLQGKDMEITRKSCQKFQYSPVSILNFMEGTRFTPEKQQHQKSPYTHLLKPKTGGFAYAVEAMDGRINRMLDVTLIYHNRKANFWDFLCGRYSKITVNIEEKIIPQSFLDGNYQEDREHRKCFQNWVTELWQEKDQFIAEQIAEYKDQVKKVG